jgi:hypothetical protein
MDDDYASEEAQRPVSGGGGSRSRSVSRLFEF